uniref:Fe2OG dioxygenase domain-containing protein n=1 Tax=Chrysocystis fragilis TaxID=1411660 RepID=A0A7S0TCZ5_9STRA|mmetsp:Transcript_282/g.836  ORF Transcript_282/g.836 Transcript_282/m.836 type:complete len:135 (+) Transcript_282:527-931(+)
MNALRDALEALLDLRIDSSTFMFAEYAEGSSGYVRHRDAAPTRPSGRKLTLIYYLNPSWTPLAAGNLLLWTDRRADPVSLAPLDDRLLVFKSSHEHQVLPSRAPRRAVTTWLYNRLELGLELIAEKRALLATRD